MKTIHIIKTAGSVQTIVDGLYWFIDWGYTMVWAIKYCIEGCAFALNKHNGFPEAVLFYFDLGKTKKL